MAAESEKIYECQVKRRRLKTGGGYEPFWKLKSVTEALLDDDTEFRCSDCTGAVKVHRRHIADAPPPHIAHKLKMDSEYCPAGIFFRKATDGRAAAVRASGTVECWGSSQARWPRYTIPCTCAVRGEPKLPEITTTSSEETIDPKATTAGDAEDHETALESLASICTVLAVGLFVMTFIFQNFEIPSASMEKTLLIGDHVLVDRISLAPPSHWFPLEHYREPRRGDVIVFLKPHPETPDLYLVKRCIGIPGDRIHLEHGVVYINGVAQNEPYAQQPRDDGDPNDAYVSYRDDFPVDVAGIGQAASDNHASYWAIDLPNHIVNGDLVVPEGTVFAMGDNRTRSLDGRYWGFVPRENIVGRPMFVYWSFQTPEDQMNKTSIGDRIAFMGHVLVHVFDQTRWNRTFHVVR